MNSLTSPPLIMLVAALLLVLTSVTWLLTRTAQAQEWLLSVGVYMERNSSAQPGLEVSYADAKLLGGHPRFGLSYSTTRLATALGSNDLAKDRLLFSPSWHFRPWKRVDPYVELQLGYARYDREDPVLFALLDNDAVIAGLLFGIETWLIERIGLYGDIGYSILHSSTVYPLVASIGFHVNLSPRRQP